MKSSLMPYIASFISTLTLVAVFLFIDISYSPAANPHLPLYENFEAIFNNREDKIIAGKQKEHSTLIGNYKLIENYSFEAHKPKKFLKTQNYKTLVTKFIPLHKCSWLL